MRQGFVYFINVFLNRIRNNVSTYPYIIITIININIVIEFNIFRFAIIEAYIGVVGLVNQMSVAC